MTTGAIIRLVLQALVFIAWAFLMYRTLFTLRNRNEGQTGGTFPTTGGFMAQLKHWWQNPDDRLDRNTLLWLTFVLLTMIATSAVL